MRGYNHHGSHIANACTQHSHMRLQCKDPMVKTSRPRRTPNHQVRSPRPPHRQPLRIGTCRRTHHPRHSTPGHHGMQACIDSARIRRFCACHWHPWRRSRACTDHELQSLVRAWSGRRNARTGLRGSGIDRPGTRLHYWTRRYMRFWCRLDGGRCHRSIGRGSALLDRIPRPVRQGHCRRWSSATQSPQRSQYFVGVALCHLLACESWPMTRMMMTRTPLLSTRRNPSRNRPGHVRTRMAVGVRQ